MFGQNVAIIGAGGIGSYFCEHMAKALKTNQFGDLNREMITVYDPKDVTEINCLHQNYDMEEHKGFPKAAIMAGKHGFNGRSKKLDESLLAEHSSFIICADNQTVRNMVYEHCRATGKMFLDMRCQADMYALYTDQATEEELLTSLGPNPTDTTEYSCMSEEDRMARSLQMGNNAVANAGMQLLLNRFRDEHFPAKVDAAMVV
jgi:molybdopterin/thiamine biosynthesis adenylyltransferase